MTKTEREAHIEALRCWLRRLRNVSPARLLPDPQAWLRRIKALAAGDADHERRQAA